jgi:cysteine desulfurase/selenocysteine lyase
MRISHTDQEERSLTAEDLREDVVGIDTPVPVLDGSERRYIFLDNAASTPTFASVLRWVQEFLPWYSGVHRGTGFKSLLATEAFDRAHDLVGRFVGADLSTNTVVFVKNTTEAINKLANRFPFVSGDLVITTVMEHHSNDLPWRKYATTLHVGIKEDGSPDPHAMREALSRYKGRVKLVAVSGASNITGFCSPIDDIAEWVHDAKALLFVDAAQLAPHRPINVREDVDPRHIDFLALSAHKMYAPFGTGVLIGPKAFFEEGDPDVVGGGVVDVVTQEKAFWNHPPLKEEAGSPNVVGGIALAAAVSVLQGVGMGNIQTHEQKLLTYCIKKLKAIRGITLYGPTDDLSQRVGVIPFNIDGMHHALVAAILSTEAAIGVRNGCFCAHQYVKKLLRITPEQDAVLAGQILAGEKADIPGMVRASLGCYNNEEDVDVLADMLERIVHKDYRGNYVQDRTTGAFQAEGFHVDVGKYFPLFDDGHVAPPRGYSEAS